MSGSQQQQCKTCSDNLGDYCCPDAQGVFPSTCAGGRGVCDPTTRLCGTSGQSGDICINDQSCKFPGLRCVDGSCACGTSAETLYKPCGEKSLCVPAAGSGGDSPAPQPSPSPSPAPQPSPSGKQMPPPEAQQPPAASVKYTGFCDPALRADYAKACPLKTFVAPSPDGGSGVACDANPGNLERGAYASYCYLDA